VRRAISIIYEPRVSLLQLHSLCAHVGFHHLFARLSRARAPGHCIVALSSVVPPFFSITSKPYHSPSVPRPVNHAQSCSSNSQRQHAYDSPEAFAAQCRVVTAVAMGYLNLHQSPNGNMILHSGTMEPDFRLGGNIPDHITYNGVKLRQAWRPSLMLRCFEIAGIPNFARYPQYPFSTMFHSSSIET
jgi:hypothetical protein